MVKNQLEKKFSKSLKEDPALWGMKLHNNPLSHQNTPADFVFSYIERNTLKLVLVECKQVTCKGGKGRFAFKRLKQMSDLLNFERMRPEHHSSYLCLAYYDERWDKSDVYMIPIEFMKETIDNHTNVSINREDAKYKFKDFKMQIGERWYL